MTLLKKVVRNVVVIDQLILLACNNVHCLLVLIISTQRVVSGVPLLCLSVPVSILTSNWRAIMYTVSLLLRLQQRQNFGTFSGTQRQERGKVQGRKQTRIGGDGTRTSRRGGASYLLDDDELAGRILGERVHHGVERVHHTRTLPGASSGENELTS